MNLSFLVRQKFMLFSLLPFVRVGGDSEGGGVGGGGFCYTVL